MASFTQSNGRALEGFDPSGSDQPVTTPRQPGDDEPVTLDELSDYLAGVELPPADEERLLMRIANDPDAPNKMGKLRAVDGKIAAALGLDAVPQTTGDDPGPMDADRAARFEAALQRLARGRAERWHEDEVSPPDRARDDDSPSA